MEPVTEPTLEVWGRAGGRASEQNYMYVRDVMLGLYKLSVAFRRTSDSFEKFVTQPFRNYAHLPQTNTNDCTAT